MSRFSVSIYRVFKGLFYRGVDLDKLYLSREGGLAVAGLGYSIDFIALYSS